MSLREAQVVLLAKGDCPGDRQDWNRAREWPYQSAISVDVVPLYMPCTPLEHARGWLWGRVRAHPSSGPGLFKVLAKSTPLSSPSVSVLLGNDSRLAHSVAGRIVSGMTYVQQHAHNNKYNLWLF